MFSVQMEVCVGSDESESDEKVGVCECDVQGPSSFARESEQCAAAPHASFFFL